MFPDVLPAISIHSTTRVETTAPPSLCHAPTNFNPLHHEGGDVHPGEMLMILTISIHSTTRVETAMPLAGLTVVIYFNPLHHEGGDVPSPPVLGIPWDFNPLHHEGGDALLLLSSLGFSISIHSTTRVETILQTSCGYHHRHFNPLHHEGGDGIVYQGINELDLISIHSTTRVETSCSAG